MVETFLLVLAAIFPVVNPPGAALVFLSMTQHASIDARRSLARRIALNAFFVMAGSLLVGAFILKNFTAFPFRCCVWPAALSWPTPSWSATERGQSKERRRAARRRDKKRTMRARPFIP